MTIHSRRAFLGKMGAVSLTAPFLGACHQSQSSQNNTDNSSKSTKNCLADHTFEFYGEHQAGITTPSQRHIYFLVADLHTTDLETIKTVFKNWTAYSEKLTQGQNIQAYGDNAHVPPIDTGEADSLSAYGLTLTFGVSRSFLEKLGLHNKIPADFSELPSFPRDQIKPNLSGGDICIQACSDDAQVAFHAVRQLVRQARNAITMKWSQSGFTSYDTADETPRNLFGFKDGTANTATLKEPNKHLWVDSGWLKNGTYLVARVIQMHLETWDRTSLNGQNETFGRIRNSGAAMGQLHEFDPVDVTKKDENGNVVMPAISHTALANRSGLQILRRSYSYSSGIVPNTGQFDAGLLFISFQKTPMQFVGIQTALGRVDKMNEYITHIGSGLFACFGGIKKGEYLGQALFEN
ncbi:iron uptake transporter deferrochelatase/peroxidase subunit [Moraxella nasovis]|uniref:iron uptake transporter deferrochelatase/peroxidase subunit n=1 Tax=Moraxella nasovis TaxID=2904121 RepID=UPI001F621276|nr:iron uptake transporter deferrochelatase/peroxidase subunit [Moraxella nasovis]UNU73450.1 iron uptake transporter deferrochelatase/peroxidase subunit [Moraxella nasovis]